VQGCTGPQRDVPAAVDAITVHGFPGDPFLPVPAEDLAIRVVEVPSGDRHIMPSV